MNFIKSDQLTQKLHLLEYHAKSLNHHTIYRFLRYTETHFLLPEYILITVFRFLKHWMMMMWCEYYLHVQCNELNRGHPTFFVAPFSKYLVAFPLMEMNFSLQVPHLRLVRYERTLILLFWTRLVIGRKMLGGPGWVRYTVGAFHSTKYSGLIFRVFHATNGTVFSGSLYYPIPGHQVPSFARKYEIKRIALLPLFTCLGVARRLRSWKKKKDALGEGDNITFIEGVRDYIYGTSLFSWWVQEPLSNDERAVHICLLERLCSLSRSSVFSHYSLKLVRLIHCNNVAERYFNRLSDRGLVFRLEAWGQPCWFPGSERLGTSRNGRMERNFPVIPILRNFRPTSRGTPKISKWNSGKCLFHSLPNPEFPEFLVEWKAPHKSKESMVHNRKFMLKVFYTVLRN